MRPPVSYHAPALCGCDFVRDGNGLIEKKTYKGWVSWAGRRAKSLSRLDSFSWTPVVCWIDWRDAYRISFAGQEENV